MNKDFNLAEATARSEKEFAEKFGNKEWQTVFFETLLFNTRPSYNGQLGVLQTAYEKQREYYVLLRDCGMITFPQYIQLYVAIRRYYIEELKSYFTSLDNSAELNEIEKMWGLKK